MKTWIWLAVIVIIAAIAYFYFEGGSSSNSSLEVTSDNNAAVGAQVLGLLNQIKSLNIDATFFSNPIFLTLHDFTVPIPSQNVGRTNPFAPLPGDVIPAPTTSK